jgi:cullin-4
MSFVQALVLLSFNTLPKSTSGQESASYWTLEAICAHTGLGLKECTRVVSSLTLGKVKLLSLVRDSEGPLVPTDEFIVNDAFTHSLYRIKVPAGGQKTPVTTKDAESSEMVTEKVVADRKFVIEAAIVRILKMRRRISHNDLMKEVFEQCKFAIDAGDVKGRVETLIDREYIARDGEVGVYVYVA